MNVTKTCIKKIILLWRNKVAKLRKTSIKEYIGKSCNNDIESKKFYNAVKPYVSSCSSNGGRVILGNIFNDFFPSIAEFSHISDGLDVHSTDNAVKKHSKYMSIENINKSLGYVNIFNLSPFIPEYIEKYISRLQTNMAVDHDGSTLCI